MARFMSDNYPHIPKKNQSNTVKQAETVLGMFQTH